jgi:hypothetical protein
MRRWLWIALACFVVVGCADNDNRTNGDRFGGFYGGVSGGAEP